MGAEVRIRVVSRLRRVKKCDQGELGGSDQVPKSLCTNEKGGFSTLIVIGDGVFQQHY